MAVAMGASSGLIGKYGPPARAAGGELEA